MKRFKIVILASRLERLISRILIILNRRNINILSLTVSFSEESNTMRFSVRVESYEKYMENLIKQIEKQIGVMSVLYYENDKEKFNYSHKTKKSLYSTDNILISNTKKRN